MRTQLCKQLGIEIPIFAFTHCRDVVVEVSKAGGMGVLGAVGFTPEKLREELDWIDAHIGDLPYAVDIVIPQKYEGIGNIDPAELEQQLESMVPQEHRDFAARPPHTAANMRRCYAVNRSTPPKILRASSR